MDPSNWKEAAGKGLSPFKRSTLKNSEALYLVELLKSNISDKSIYEKLFPILFIHCIYLSFILIISVKYNKS